jgi:hypothetical protein
VSHGVSHWVSLSQLKENPAATPRPPRTPTAEAPVTEKEKEKKRARAAADPTAEKTEASVATAAATVVKSKRVRKPDLR